MAQENASKSIAAFKESLMDDFLQRCQTEEEKQAFLTGMFVALHAYFRFANPNRLKPFEREYFISSLRSGVFSDLMRCNLNPNSLAELKALFQEDFELEGMAASYNFAAGLQKLMGDGLDPLELTELANVFTISNLQLSTEDLQKLAEK